MAKELMAQQNSARLHAIRADLETRLRRVCAGWPASEFEAMLDRLAEVTLRYEGVAADELSARLPLLYDRRATDRIIADLKETLERNQTARQPRKKRRPRA